MKSVKIVAAMCLISGSVVAENVPITGTVQSRCSIVADVPGTYGNPNAYTLTTSPSDGGVLPVVRVDVSLADAYKAQISYPTAFSSSPSLDDTVTWTGSTSVQAVSTTDMADYDTNKVTFGSTTEYDLTAAGSTWFKTSSTATYGGSKAFPGGTYSSVVEVVCIAK